MLDMLQWLGLGWDGEPVYQSERMHLYHAAAEKLLAAGHAYYCECTTEQVQARLSQIRIELGRATQETDIEVLRERLAKLSSSLAVIHVGAATAPELGEKLRRTEGAVAASRRDHARARRLCRGRRALRGRLPRRGRLRRLGTAGPRAPAGGLAAGAGSDGTVNGPRSTDWSPPTQRRWPHWRNIG